MMAKQKKQFFYCTIFILLFTALLFSSFVHAGDSGRKILSGLTKTESPVPFGKISWIIGYGWENKDDIDLRMIILEDSPVHFPVENTGMNNILKLKGERVTIHQNHEQILTIELPGKGFGVALLALDNSRNIENSLFINKARLDWLSSDYASSGDTVRAFGRALVSLSNYNERDIENNPVDFAGYVDSDTKIAVKDVQGNFHWVDIIQGSSYDVWFKIPDGLPHGNAEVFVHNGHGGAYGWSSPKAITIKDKPAWPKKVFNVLEFGAVGDGFADDGPAIQKALDAAEMNGGGIVYFPRGGYHFNQTLRVPDKTVLKGESRERSWLYMPDGYHTNGRDASVKVGIAGKKSLGLEDLSIHAVYTTMIIAAPVGEKIQDGWQDFANNTEVPEISADNSFINRCRILHNFSHLYHRRHDDTTFQDLPYLNEMLMDHWKSTTFAIRGNYVSITNSEFLGKGMGGAMLGCRYSRVANNIFHSGETANGITFQHSVDGYSEIIFENNILDGTAKAHHAASWLMHGGKNLFISGNQLLRQFWVSDNEGLCPHMWGYRLPLYIKKFYPDRIEVDLDKYLDYWNTVKSGTNQHCNPYHNSAKKPEDLSVFIGKEVQVHRGQGLGLVNRIKDVKGNVIIFEKAFSHALNKESLLVVHEFDAFRNLVITGNRIEDAGVAIMVWGHGHEIVIDGNDIARSGMIAAWSVLWASNIAGGCHFYQVINNKCDEGRYRVIGQHEPGGRYNAGGIGTNYSVLGDYKKGGGLHYVGYIIRNNLIQNDCTYAFGGYEHAFFKEKIQAANEQQVVPYDHLGMVFEDNQNKHSKFGMVFGNSVKAVLRNNSFHDVDNEIIVSNDGDEIIQLDVDIEYKNQDKISSNK